jgi:hypothetical protein
LELGVVNWLAICHLPVWTLNPFNETGDYCDKEILACQAKIGLQSIFRALTTLPIHRHEWWRHAVNVQ